MGGRLRTELLLGALQGRGLLAIRTALGPVLGRRQVSARNGELRATPGRGARYLLRKRASRQRNTHRNLMGLRWRRGGRAEWHSRRGRACARGETERARARARGEA